jgi:hypothetical protein
LQASAQVLLKSNALDLISFQLRPIWYSQSELGSYLKVFGYLAGVVPGE